MSSTRPRSFSLVAGVVRSAVAAGAAAHLLAAPSIGIVVRHDVEAAEFERLAGEYAAPLVGIRYRDATGTVVAEGTLIADSWVLTAAHVVTAMTPGAKVKYRGAEYEVSEVHVHPGWTGEFENLHDIALLALRAPVVDSAPARISRGTEEAGHEIVVIGRGMSGTGLTGPVVDDGVLRAATNSLSEVGERHLSFSFDAPDSDSASPLEGISGPGDSGGPALMREGDAIVVLGVSSAQDDAPTGGRAGRYGVLEYYSRVSAFATWIDEVMAARPAESP